MKNVYTQMKNVYTQIWKVESKVYNYSNGKVYIPK